MTYPDGLGHRLFCKVCQSVWHDKRHHSVVILELLLGEICEPVGKESVGVVEV